MEALGSNNRSQGPGQGLIDLPERRGSGGDNSPAVESPLGLEALLRGDATDCLLRNHLALRLPPACGWHAATGFRADQLRHLQREEELRRRRMLISESEAASPRLLHTLFRHKLLDQLDRAQDLASLNTIGRLLEKIPQLDAGAGDQSATGQSQRARQLLSETRTIIERLEGSLRYMDEAGADGDGSQ